MNLHIEPLPGLPGKSPKAVADAHKEAGDIIARHNAMADQREQEIRKIEAKSPELFTAFDFDVMRTALAIVTKERIAALESIREPVAVVAEWVKSLPTMGVQEAIDGLAEKLLALGWTIKRGSAGEWVSAPDENGRLSGFGANGFLRSHPAVAMAMGTNDRLQDAKSQWQKLPGDIELAVAESQEYLAEQRRRIVRSFTTA